MSSNVVTMGPLQYEPLDPRAICDSCGQLGTVGVTVLHGGPEVVRRFCEACWPAARSQFEDENERRTLAWMQASIRAGPYDRPEKPPGTSIGSRSWYDVGEFIRRFVLRPDGTPGLSATELSSIAHQIQADAAKMNGPMPEPIAAFVTKYLRAAT